MLLTIRQSGPGAQGLPWLLHHDPDSLKEVEFPLGKAKVFFPEFGPDLVEAALLLEPTPLTKADPAVPFFSTALPISQYVNAHDFLSSSLMALALETAFPEALRGDPIAAVGLATDPEATRQVRSLEINLTAVPGADNEVRLRKILALSGYEIQLEPIPLSATHSEWGTGPACHVRLQGQSTLADILRRLYFILMALEEEKEFWVGLQEADAVWEKSRAWFSEEELEEIRDDYFGRRNKHFNIPLKLLGETVDPQSEFERGEAREAALEAGIGLQKARREAIFEAVKRSGARTVLDLNCGHARLVELLLRDPQFTAVSAIDISFTSLHAAAEYLNRSGIGQEEAAKLSLLPGSPLFRDERTVGFDAAVLADWIEHLPPTRLSTLEMSVFRYMKPQHVVITTPNAEYNPLLPDLPLGQKRHPLHHFEWTRAEFKTWAEKVAEKYDFRVRFVPVGPQDPQLGPATQMAIFSRIKS